MAYEIWARQVLEVTGSTSHAPRPHLDGVFIAATAVDWIWPDAHVIEGSSGPGQAAHYGKVVNCTRGAIQGLHV